MTDMTIEPRAVADIQVPEELSRLRELAYNLWWSWTPRARLLFASIDKQLWARYRNPVQLLINIEPHHWDSLINDGGAFMSQYRSVIRDFDRYMEKEDTWFKTRHADYDKGPIGYFSTEFGLHESLGIYCGGLGVLSGDHAKAASDMDLPFVGVGVLYRKGYFRQAIDPDGRQHHIFNDSDFFRLPLRPLHDTTGRDLIISVEFPDRQVYVRVWRLTVGRVFLYLLDTDILDNEPGDRPITSQLYVRGREMRLCQEMVLGIGGVRALRALNIEPAVWHMNEGHSAFQVVERLRENIRDGMKFSQALEAIRENTIFTTHTPVPAGNEAFDPALVERYLTVYADSMGLDVKQLLDLGKSYPGKVKNQPYNLTAVGIRSSVYSNGVSKLHGEVATQMWQHLFKKKDDKANAVKYVTNGVHRATWLGHDIRSLLEESVGDDWTEHFSDTDYWQNVKNIKSADLWEAHQSQKDRMIRLVRQRLMAQFARHGKSPEEIREVGKMLDRNILTIGFARRFATYKRAGLIFHDLKRLESIITHPDHPVQIIFSGKAHPADLPGQELVKDIVNKAFYSSLKGNILFLEDYEMRVARHLVQGVDIWLNTPRRPREASGTSGMKAAMNGAPNFSISDGWWPEAYNGKNGWLIGIDENSENEELQDYEDAASFYDILENEIIPAYYGRDNGVPEKWVDIMKESMATIIPAFSATRMLEDYVR
ncbi:MAG: alpha-glucan family phosphorylase, partial [Spartobacteria bacterium]|nr:alpha-glucan family phosphorylase [Spartobacteria bacterium]